MSSKKLYFTKQKHSSQHEGRMERELPSEIMKNYLRNQEHIKPRATPRTTEELLYRQRIQEKLKPPSVKMAEAEERRVREDERKAEEARKEARQEEMALAIRTLPGLTENNANILERLIAEMSIPPEFKLSPEEERVPLVKEEKDIEKELRDASVNQPLSKNLNNLFNTPRRKTTEGIKVINKLSADGLTKALRTAEQDDRTLDEEFKKAIRDIIKAKKRV